MSFDIPKGHIWHAQPCPSGSPQKPRPSKVQRKRMLVQQKPAPNLLRQNRRLEVSPRQLGERGSPNCGRFASATSELSFWIDTPAGSLEPHEMEVENLFSNHHIKMRSFLPEVLHLKNDEPLQK